MVDFIKSQRGADKLHYEGFAYVKYRGEEDKTFWRCEKYRIFKCKGRVVSRERNVVLLNEHNHGPSPVLYEVARTSQIVKAMATTSSDSPRSIVARCMQGVSVEASNRGPKLKSHEKAVTRQRDSTKQDQFLTAGPK